MAGFWTNGLAQPSTGGGSLPLPYQNRIPVDTGLPSGSSPQSVGMTRAALIANGGFTSITTSTVPSIDASVNDKYSITASTVGNMTLSITNQISGQIIRLRVTQDGTGGRTITVSTASGTTLTSSTVPLSTAAASVDLVELQAVTTSSWLYYPVAKGLA